ncbi:T9SS type A sorting domain-containing protein [Hymenobacter setariae]|uniref:T9SS type A sorting domain-containing protein n=1 Tax=Hymenobacter setariae TaxID=2594794 RepID=A0A558BPN7_9BACT|nr:T9SS type A sorting domain-containing protein [Hymenobacter setariae]TVT38484.1 T9SS type A sorting domain-containing protein [Hymenobacter setariae]
MQKIVCLWVWLLGWAWSAHAQNAALACGNGRYVDDLPGVQVQVTPNVLFGSNTVRNYYTGAESAPVELRLDVYEPAGDAAVQRPLLIFAFGGSFLEGARTKAEVVSICQGFARKGYVAAAIDYRLLNQNIFSLGAVYADQTKLVDEVIRAAADMKAAIRFFKRDAATTNTYRIDPTRIFVGGYSAGAITALQVAYTESITENALTTKAYNDNGGLEGNTDLPGAPLLGTYDASGIAGVVNIAGGVNNTSIVNAGNPPLYSAQGDKDDVVPYNCALLKPTQFNVCGSGALEPIASAAGIANQLHPVADGNHSSPVAEPTYTQIINEAAAFLQRTVLCPAAPLPVTLTSFSGRVLPDDCTATLTWQTATEHNSYAYEVQGSTDGQDYERLSTVPSRNRAAGASYSFRVGRRVDLGYFRLRMLDIDGTATFSPVVVLAGCGAAPLLVAPNPARDQVAVRGLPAGRCLGALYSATGQVVAQASGAGTISLQLGSLPPGIYLLKVQSESGAVVGTAKVVKE